MGAEMGELKLLAWVSRVEVACLGQAKAVMKKDDDSIAEEIETARRELLHVQAEMEKIAGSGTAHQVGASLQVCACELHSNCWPRLRNVAPIARALMCPRRLAPPYLEAHTRASKSVLKRLPRSKWSGCGAVLCKHIASTVDGWNW